MNKSKLILLHGAIGNSNQLQPLQQKLSTHFEVFIFEFPGHELNSNNTQPYSIDLFSTSLLTFVQHNNLQNAIVIGYSMGGYVALHLATTNTNIFKSIITIGTKFHWDMATSENEVKMLVPTVIEQKVPKYAEQLKSVFGVNYWVSVLNKTSELMLSLGNQPVLSKINLSNVQIPVLILRGELDKMVTEDESKLFSSYIPNSHYLELLNSPHPIERLDLDNIQSIALNFLKQHQLLQ